VKRFVLLSTILFTVMWAAMTWPQVRHMHDRVNDVGDPLLNTWALAWVAHQLPFAPAHVFDGNIFHPEPRTLAYSETLLAPGLIGAPLLWAGAGPVLVYNLLLMLAFVASGLGTALLVRELTGSSTAGVVAGAIFAFLPIRFDHYAHFQLLQTQWMPLALWGLHRFLASGRSAWAVVLGGAVGAQALTSMYNAIFLGMLLVAVGGFLLLAERRHLRARLPGIALAMALAGVMAAPAAIAHTRASAVVGERSRGEVQNGSAEWQNFLSAAPTNRLYGRWTDRFGGAEHRLFLGALGIVLAAVALWPPWSATRLAYAIGLVVALDVSRGLNGWIYGLLYDHVFVFRGLRIPARMAMLAGLALAVLAGFGVARLIGRGVSSRGRFALGAGLLAIVMLEAWSAPIGLTAVATEMPPTYADLLADKGDPPRRTIIRRLSDRPPAVIVELPINQEDPTFMYYSTFHWQTLVNGYSGFYSSRYVMLHDVMKRFPAPPALETLASLQTRYVVVHGELMPPDHYRALTARLDTSPSFRLVSKRPWQRGEIALYRFRWVPGT
jgi:hypothetical protein